MAKKKTTANPVLGLVQMTCSPDPDKNLKKAIARIGEAARKGATIVCLQELFRSQYFCQTEDTALFSLAEAIPGPTTAKLAKVARQHDVVLVASLFERRAAGVAGLAAPEPDPSMGATRTLPGPRRVTARSNAA